MKRISYYIFCFLFLFSLLSYAQKVNFSGYIFDEYKRPIANANVIVKYKSKSENLDFTITDKKGFYSFYLRYIDTVKVSISHIAYEKVDFIFFGDKSMKKDFILSEASETLDNIEIEMPVMVKGDTTIYKVDKFLRGGERKLKNVLERLPGIEVDNNGKINVNGKTVSKILVEGDEFFGGNSKLAVNNIPSGVIDKVEVLDNYNKVSFLKGLSDSDKLAMNIKLKKEKKNFLFGDIGIGYGNRKFYKNNSNLFYYSPKNSYNLITNSNNIGDNPLTFDDYISFQESSNSIFNEKFNWNGGDFSQFIDSSEEVLNTSQHFGGLNILNKLSDKVSMSSYGIFSKINDESLNQIRNTYAILDEEKSYSNISNKFIGLGRLNLDFKPSINESVFINLKIKSINSQNENTINSKINSTESDFYYNQLKTQNIIVNNVIEWHKNKSKKHTFSTLFRLNYTKSNDFDKWDSDGDRLGDLVSVINNQDRVVLNQNIINQNLYLNTIVKHFWKINSVNHFYTTYTNKNFISQFLSKNYQILNNNEKVEITNENNFSNDLIYNNITHNINFNYRFKKGIFTVNTGVDFQNNIWSISQFEMDFSKNKFLLLPNIFLDINFNKFKKIKIYYNLESNIQETKNLTKNFYLNSYNSIFRGNPFLENDLYHNLHLRYSSFNLYRGNMFNINFYYKKFIYGASDIISFNNYNNILSTESLNSPNENFTLRSSFYKKIKNIRLKLKGKISNNNRKQVVNSIVKNNEVRNYSYTIGIETLFKKIPNINIDFLTNDSNFSNGDRKYKFKSNELYLKLGYNFLDSFNFQFDYIYNNYSNKSINFTENYSLSNLSINYQITNSPWTFSLETKNLFDVRYIRDYSFNQLFTSDSQRFILPLSILFNVNYNF